LLSRVGHPHVRGCHGGPVQRHERQPVAADHPGPDRRDRGPVRAGVHVDRLELADLGPAGVEHLETAPVPDVLSLEHEARLPPGQLGKHSGSAAKPDLLTRQQTVISGCANLHGHDDAVVKYCVALRLDGGMGITEFR